MSSPTSSSSQTKDQTRNDSSPKQTFQAVTQVMNALLTVLDDATATVGNSIISPFQPWIEPVATRVGQVVTPIATLPFVKMLTLVPGMKWLLAALGQVNVDTVRQEIANLRHQYPQDSQRALARRVMAETTLQAAGVGLVTNFAPPIAFALTLVDIGAVAALQANMIYRIAAIYGYSPSDSDRRGEVLAIWFLSSSASGMVKSGLSLVETIPALGAAVGIATDATLIYSVGYFACRYYETKRLQPTEITLA